MISLVKVNGRCESGDRTDCGMTDLTTLTVAEARAALAKKEFSAVELADKCASASSTALNSFFASAARASATVRVVRSVMPQSVRSPDSHRPFTLTREIIGSRYARPRTAKRG